MPDKIQSRPQPAEARAAALARAQRVGLGALPWMNMAAAEKLADIGVECLEFVSERLREDVKTQHEVLHCKNAAELHRIQDAFLQTAIDQYAAQTGRMVAMGNELMTAMLARKTV